MHDDRHDEAGVVRDFRLGQAEAGLQRRERDALESAARAIGMQRRQRSRMSGVDRLQEGIGFGAADLSEEQTIGAKPQARLQQILDGDTSEALITFGREQREMIGLGRTQLARVLDRDHALVHGDFLEEGVEERRLSRGRPARNHHGHSVPNREFQRGHAPLRRGVAEQPRQLAIGVRRAFEIDNAGTARPDVVESAKPHEILET